MVLEPRIAGLGPGTFPDGSSQNVPKIRISPKRSRNPPVSPKSTDLFAGRPGWPTWFLNVGTRFGLNFVQNGDYNVKKRGAAK